MAGEIDPRTRELLMYVREGLLIVLGALENYLDLPRTKVPRRKRGPPPLVEVMRFDSGTDDSREQEDTCTNHAGRCTDAGCS